MNEEAPKTALREIGASIRRTAELRYLCLSLREAMNREKEASLLVEFERSFLDANGPVPTDVQVLRAGFREMWRRGEYARVIAMARRLPGELVEGDETILMYFTCAERRQRGRG
jgi:hypothetical protein